MKRALSLSINGDTYQLLVQPRDTLLRVLRDYLGLTGTKEGCGTGNCGACTVLLDGQPVNACIVLAAEAEGHVVTSIEGLALKGQLQPLQQAFIDFGGLQCGFCTPGLLLNAHAFLASHPHPSEAEVRRAIAGNLCRCTGYDKVVRAVLATPRGEAAPAPAPGMGAVGQRLPRADGVAKVTGQAIFGADLNLPGMLYGKVLRSPFAHARIRKLDLGPALAMEGVRAAISAADLPPLSPEVAARAGEMYVNIVSQHQATMARDKAVYHGQAVAAVAATDPHLAEEALGRIRVEFEELPVVEDALEAMKPDSPLVWEGRYSGGVGEQALKPSNIASHLEMGRGDAEAAFPECDVVVERTYRTQMVHQGYLEPQAALASVDAQGKVTVWTSTQGAFDAKIQICNLLGLPQTQVKVVPTEVGGGFGGKLTVWIEPLAILLARKAGRPVKMVLTREEVFQSTGPASPSIITIKMGANRSGEIKAMKATFVYDAGAFPGAPVSGGIFSGLSPYRIPHFRVDGFDVVTNKPWVMAYRAPGTPQAAFAVEAHLDILAEALGLDPLELRRRNAAAEGDMMPSERPFNRIGFRELLDRVASHAAWKGKLEGPHRGRGLACALWFGGVMTSSAQVAVNGDGTVAVAVGTPDLTGSRTSLLQIAAEALGLPPEKLSITVGDTESVAYSDVSGGSRTTYSMGTAVYRACQDALAQLKQRAAPLLQAKTEEIEYEKGSFRLKGSAKPGVPLAEVARSSIRRGEGPILGRGSLTRLQPAPAFAAHVVDVEVDPETGKVRLLNYTAFQDVGRAINPTLVEGQMQGGAAQGIGWALSEGYVFDKGRLLNTSLMDYRIPTATDVPFIDTELIEVPAPDGPYGVRGVGEVPIVPPPAALANAISRATGVRLTRLPMSPEQVFWALQGDRART